MKRFIISAAIGTCVLSSNALAVPCVSYPHTLTNGTTASATDVMDNFSCAARTGGATMDGTTFTGVTSYPGSTTITATGAVGVGITAPSALLQVNHGGDNYTAFQVGDMATVSSKTGIYMRSTAEARLSIGAGAELTFFTGGPNGSEMGRFGTDGSLLMGTTSNGGWPGNAKAEIRSSVHALSVYTSGSTGGVALISRVDNSSNWLAGFYYGTTNVGGITTNGTATAYNTTSDGRLKNTNIAQRNYKNVIERLWVGDFKWKKDGESGFGIIAQQVFPLFPEAVHKPTRKSGIWQADYSKLAPLALWGVKDLYREADKQSSMVAAQALEIARLKERLAELEVRSAVKTASKRASRLTVN